ncbi:MAG: zf-HC2 domain-containing protein [Peptostreptococcaceae bacterium]
MNKVSCEVIKDLLPLYYDDICSDASKVIVNEHISQCSSCSEELRLIKESLDCIDSKSKEGDKEELLNISQKLKSNRRKSILIGVIVSLVLFIVADVGIRYFGFVKPTIPIEMSNVNLIEVGEYEGDSYIFSYSIKDGTLVTPKLTTDGEGNKYITFYKPIIGVSSEEFSKEKRIWAFDVNEFENSGEVENVYLGTEDDRVLLWSRKISVPKASENLINLLED